MSVLKEAIAATHPEHAVNIEAIEAWLTENGYEVAETYRRRADRLWAEKEAEKSAAKAVAKARWEARPLYAGTNVKRCQGSVLPARGAPSRCNIIQPLRVARAYDGRPVAVCRKHGSDNHVSYYNGWGGDPHPKIATVEAEYVAALEAAEAAMQ